MNAKTIGRYLLVLGAVFVVIAFTSAVWSIWTSDLEVAKNLEATAVVFGAAGVAGAVVGALAQLD